MEYSFTRSRKAFPWVVKHQAAEIVHSSSRQHLVHDFVRRIKGWQGVMDFDYDCKEAIRYNIKWIKHGEFTFQNIKTGKVAHPNLLHIVQGMIADNFKVFDHHRAYYDPKYQEVLSAIFQRLESHYSYSSIFNDSKNYKEHYRSIRFVKDNLTHCFIDNTEISKSKLDRTCIDLGISTFQHGILIQNRYHRSVLLTNQDAANLLGLTLPDGEVIDMQPIYSWMESFAVEMIDNEMSKSS